MKRVKKAWETIKAILLLPVAPCYITPLPVTMPPPKNNSMQLSPTDSHMIVLLCSSPNMPKVMLRKLRVGLSPEGRKLASTIIRMNKTNARPRNELEEAAEFFLKGVAQNWPSGNQSKHKS